MNERFARFAKLSGWEKWNAMTLVWARILTELVYRRAFGQMGHGCLIRRPIMLKNTGHVDLGNNVLIFDGARLETVTERYGNTFHPRVHIGDGATFQQNFHLTCASEIIIGKKVAVTENVGIFDIWHPFEDINSAIVDQPLRTSPVRIDDETLIGMGAVIQPGVRIGRHCVIGANSVVTSSIPDYCVAVGAPARIVKHYDHDVAAWISVK